MYQTILHATDLSGNHFNMCQQALAIAKHFHAKLFLIHVIEPSTSMQLAQGLGFAELKQPSIEDATTVMRLLGEALSIPDDRQFVETGSIKTHVIEKSIELGCELLILGKHTPSNLPAFLGSTAREILHEAPCDVLTLQT